MAENSGFFASVGGDRKYNMDFLARWIASIISNGVYNGELAVTADGSGMTVTIPAGRAWINGYHYRNDGPLTLPIANADGVLHRKDTVVLRWDVNARSINAIVLQGAPASNPIAPAIVRTVEQYDLKIAEISIPAGTTAITGALITDTRLDNSVCGIVHGVVEQVDTTTLYNQIQADLTQFRATNEADFTTWVQGLKDVLDETAAGNLQNEIDAILAQKGTANGIATLDEHGHVPTDQLNLLPPNYAGTLIVHVTSSDGGSVSGTRVRIRNEQLGSNYVQDLDALANTTFSLLDNHIYYVVLLDYPAAYYGAAATVQIAGGETQTLTLTLKTTPDVVGWREKVTTGEVEYIEGATDFQPMSVTNGTTDFGSWGENWICDMRPCLLKNGVVQYYLKQTGTLTFDYTKQANGTASDITSGDDGDVMIEFPRKYYKTYLENEANGDVYMYWLFAQTPVDDTWCSNAWMNKDGVIQDAMYLSAYDGVEFNGKLRSLSGVAPTVSKTIGEFRTLANANGTGYEQQEWTKRVYVQALLPLLFRGLDSQALVGKGVSSASAKIDTGTMNSKPLFWGDQTGTSGVKFAGIENFWGNINKWCDGLINVQNVYKYKIYGPYNDTADGYLDAGTIGGTTGEYIDTMQAANGYGMLPATTVSDETSSKFHDYFWKGTSNTYVCRTGGSWGRGVSVGAFYLDLDNSASNADGSIGASLSYTPV